MISEPSDRNKPRTKVSIRYDPLGRRISKTSQQLLQGRPSGNVVTTRFVWEGYRLLQEIHDGTPLTYVYSDSQSYEPLARIDGVESPEIYWFHNAANGMPELLTDSEGQKAWEGINSPWGKLLRESSQRMPIIQQNLRMQGQYLDRETGLHYNLFRYYDPDSGRFTQQDPIGLAGGINLYQYAPNALGWVDPWGLSRCSVKPTKRLPEAEQGQYNYRGIHKGHPEWDNALNGKVVPGNVSSKISPEEHNFGGVSGNSPYTSWTDDPAVARGFAGADGVVLRVKTGAPKPSDAWSWEYSFDEWMEREILMKGVRFGDVEVFLP